MRLPKVMAVLLLFIAPDFSGLAISDTVKVENLVFEGAGIRGIAYCGALMELDDRGLLSCIDKVAGTSSGAITACLLALGYAPSEIATIVGDTDFQKFNDGKYGFVGGMMRVKKRLGYYKGEHFLKWLERLIEKKTGNRDMTFTDIIQARSTQLSCVYKELVIATTCLNHQKTLLFSAETFPHMRIADAVHASMAIPFYYEPVIINTKGKVIPFDQMKDDDMLCVDGGFTANFIIDCFDQMDAFGSTIHAPTLGMRMDSDAQIAEDRNGRALAYQHIETVSDFSVAFYYIIKESLNRQTLTEEDWKRTVSISDCGIGPKVKRMSEEEKSLLINAGRAAVAAYCEK